MEVSNCCVNGNVGIGVDDSTNLHALAEKAGKSIVKDIQKGILKQIGPQLIQDAFLKDSPESRQWRVTILNDYCSSANSIMKSIYNYIGWNTLTEEEIKILESEEFLENLPKMGKYKVVLQIPEVKESSLSLAEEHLKKFEGLFRTAIKESVLVPQGLISGRLDIASEHMHVNIRYGMQVLKLTNPMMTMEQEESLYDILKKFFTTLDAKERKFFRIYTLRKNFEEKKITYNPSDLFTQTKLLKDKEKIENSLVLLKNHKNIESNEFSQKILDLLTIKTRLKGKASLLEYAKGIVEQCSNENLQDKYYLKGRETNIIYSREGALDILKAEKLEMDILKAKVEKNFRIFINHLVSVYPFFIDKEVFDILGIQKPEIFAEIAKTKLKLIEPNLRMMAIENS